MTSYNHDKYAGAGAGGGDILYRFCLSMYTCGSLFISWFVHTFFVHLVEIYCDVLDKFRKLAQLSKHLGQEKKYVCLLLHGNIK